MAVPFEYDDGNGVDFEPFTAFLSAEETTSWLRAWTGNQELNGDDFRVFGEDGTGGYAAFWLIGTNQALVDQPVVFFGSEGDIGVVARDLGDFLWLLADGLGPAHAEPYSSRDSRPNHELVGIAERFAPDRRKSGATVMELASQAYPGFGDAIEQLCR
jgi:hypothetical protein